MIQIHTLTGSYNVDNQRYKYADGSEGSYLEEVGCLTNGSYSQGFGDFIETWSNEISYASLSRLISARTGEDQLSVSGIQSYLIRKASCISKEWVSKSNEAKQISVSESVDIYDERSKEVLLFMDDVCVKAQKPQKKVARTDKDAKRLDTTTALIQGLTSKDFIPVTEGIDSKGRTTYPIEQGIIDAIISVHGTKEALPIVAVTDGARTIRLTLFAIFGTNVCIILDWYHLRLKIKNLMSMIALNKVDKELYINELSTLLWFGEVDKAIHYLSNLSTVKNVEAQATLCTYIQKHAHEIINYDLRKKQKKTIGSGRGEKINDTIVAHRQKKKGMAWSASGSKALAIIKTNDLQKKRAQNLKDTA